MVDFGYDDTEPSINMVDLVWTIDLFIFSASLLLMGILGFGIGFIVIYFMKDGVIKNRNNDNINPYSRV